MKKEMPSIEFTVVPLKAVLLLVELMCPDCQDRARTILAENIPGVNPLREETAAPPSLADIISGVSMETGISPRMILSRNRGVEFVAARRRVSEIAFNAGYPLQTIGTALGLHHTSVMNLIKNCPKKNRVVYTRTAVPSSAKQSER